MNRQRPKFRRAACGMLLGVGLLSVVGAAPVGGADKSRPIRALLVIGGCCHDYAKQKDILTRGIAERVNVQWTVAYDPDTTVKHLNPIYENPDWAKNFDVIVHDECTTEVKDLSIIDRILQPHRDGLPAVLLHCGMHCYRTEGWPKTVTPWFEFSGLSTTGHGPQLPIVITHVDKESPITRGLENWTTVNEELYNNFTGKLLDSAHALTRGKQRGVSKSAPNSTSDNVVVWTNLYKGKTRVFATTLGHNNATVANPRYLDLVARGLLWSVDKLEGGAFKPSRKLPKAEPLEQKK